MNSAWRRAFLWPGGMAVDELGPESGQGLDSGELLALEDGQFLAQDDDESVLEQKGAHGPAEGSKQISRVPGS